MGRMKMDRRGGIYVRKADKEGIDGRSGRNWTRGLYRGWTGGVDYQPIPLDLIGHS